MLNTKALQIPTKYKIFFFINTSLSVLTVKGGKESVSPTKMLQIAMNNTFLKTNVVVSVIKSLLRPNGLM